MNLYKVSKKVFWPFVDEIREHYKEHCASSYRVVEDMGKRAGDRPGRILEVIRQLNDKKYATYFRLYDPGHPYWLFHVLESDIPGIFKTDLQLFMPTVLPLFFEANTPKEYRANQHTANWIDTQLAARRFMLVPIVDAESLQAKLDQLTGFVII